MARKTLEEFAKALLEATAGHQSISIAAIELWDEFFEEPNTDNRDDKSEAWYYGQPIRVFKLERKITTAPYEKVEVGIAKFIRFGSDYEEFEQGPGNYTTAVIEWPDGTLGNVAVEMCQFIRNQEEKK